MPPLELESVYRDHRQGLFTLALSITKCRSHAEDAIHDAFSKLSQFAPCHIESLNGDVVSYVYACVRNASYDLLRRNVRRHQLCESIFNGYVPPRSVVSAGPDDVALTQERDRLIRQAIDRLPIEYREAVVLKVYAELTFRQIGQVLDQPLKTVATRYRRALERLSEGLKGEL